MAKRKHKPEDTKGVWILWTGGALFAACFGGLIYMTITKPQIWDTPPTRIIIVK